MVQLNNLGPKEFINYIQNKELYIFGAGKITENCVDVYCSNKKVEAVLDNNEKLWGKHKTFKGQDIEIISVDSFVKRVEGKKIEDIAVLITPHTYASEMIGQLDAIPQLNGLECYIHALIRNTKESAPEYSFTQGEPKIPKIIHYFWIGGNPLPAQLQKWIDSWKKYNPEYEIRCWNEDNYDFMKHPYMREAYESRAWGFVPDYARLDVIYQYGGIYLDTDVEVIGNFDPLLCDNAFFAMGSADRINAGVGFGAVAENSLIKELRDYYDNKHFINPDGTQNRVPCYYYQHPVFEKHGFRIVNEYQKINDVVIYPAEVMSPKGTFGLGDFYSEKTLSIHHNTGTWLASKERENVQNLERLLKTRCSALSLE
ncbi:MAG: hypothetical protein K2J60_13310 [Acetatifactor sp.]|nr:hypothetical protein [Acetatifactor sp.]